VGRRKSSIEVSKLSNWKLLDDFRQRLAEAQSARAGAGDAVDPKRQLLEKDYFSLFLFGLLNPVVDSMRGMCAASKFERVQEEVCRRPVSLGSFSEAQSVFDVDLLKEVFLDLSKEVSTVSGDPRLAALADKLHAVDGTLLPALPRMHWALWVDENNRAAKLHLKFNVLRTSASEAVITAGNACERAALRKMLKPGEIIITDRGYGQEYQFLSEMRDLGTSFVSRIRNAPVIEVSEELPITDADRTAGVSWQGMVSLGTKWEAAPIRLVRVEADGHVFQLATDLDLDAELIALIYRYRWQVELFFKWLKCILGCRHLLAESPAGVAIQTYSALIAALLLQIFTGKRPSKRAMELIEFYLLGYIELEEFTRLLNLEKNRK
jgi:hypothetical protein